MWSRNVRRSYGANAEDPEIVCRCQPPSRQLITRITKIALLFALGCLSGNQVVAQPLQRDAGLTMRIDEVLREMSTIKVGMTRRELGTVFTTEGGLSTASQRTYVYRQCPYVKVDVEFEPVGSREADEDIIARISRPYLAWSVID